MGRNSFKSKKIIWKSSNAAVASVTPKGNITAKKAGNAEITAAIKGTGYKAVCMVTVKKAGWNSAYKDFVLNKKYLTSGQEYGSDPGMECDPLVGLYDFDADGVPEMLISNVCTEQFPRRRRIFRARCRSMSMKQCRIA